MLSIQKMDFGANTMNTTNQYQSIKKYAKKVLFLVFHFFVCHFFAFGDIF